MKRYSRQRSRRRGATLVLALVCMTAMFAFAALAVDVGYLMNARTETYRSADAAAVAATWEYVQNLSDGESVTNSVLAARNSASTMAGANTIARSGPTLDTTAVNGDVRIGYLANIYQRGGVLDVSSPDRFNAVQVTVRRNEQINGVIPLFFARVFGMNGEEVAASATAAVVRDVQGFQIPSDNSNIDILPFALDLQTWNELVAGNCPDNYCWNPDTHSVTSGSDDTPEVNLYPQGTGMPGNRGTVDIGGSNNSTTDIARQILHGISPDDLAAMGGTLELDGNGECVLNGDTGISAGVKDELHSIIGEVRIIPIFSNVQGPGNNADFTICMWCGVRIMKVQLTGPMSKKKLIVQPAPCVVKGVIPGTVSGTSTNVFSRVVLVE